MGCGKWKQKVVSVLAAALLAVGIPGGVQAAVVDSEAAKSYDETVNIQGNLDSVDVTVKETTMIPGQKDDAQKTIRLKASGMQSEEDMEVSISVTTDEGEKVQYYRDGYFYTDQSGEKIKYRMDKADMLELMNYDVYLNLDSGRLSSLDLAENGSEKTYTFSATEETLGDYGDKLLEGAQKEHKIEIITVQGTMKATEENQITQRSLQTVYTVQTEEKKQACIMNAEEEFHNAGEDVNVVIPDLSAYKEQASREAVVEVTPRNQTVYATDSVNIRAQNNITAAIIGGASTGTALQEIGYTSDGWIQISYNGATGYVSEEYVSTTKPVVVVDMSGTMYATTVVNVRDAASTEGKIYGALSEDEAVTVTGYTDNNWIRIRYKGLTAYVSAAYLTWDEPVKIVSGYMSGTIASVSRTSMTVNSTQGGTYTFDISKAYMNVVDGTKVGDRVDISYNNVGGSLIATQVNDYTYHDTAERSDSEAGDMVYGVVMTYGISAVTISCDDGSTMSFVTDDTLYVRGQVYVGSYVSAAYYYDSSIGGYRLTYLGVI